VEGPGERGTCEEGPGRGELDGCIMHRVHTSFIYISKSGVCVSHDVLRFNTRQNRRQLGIP
jgi:hypothetical protein